MDKKILHECGLRGDGIADDGAALQRLLNLRPTLLEIPSGIYQVGRTLRIHSGTHLKLDAGAVIRLADGAAKNPHDYLLTNANPESGAANIIIEGGTWDGNNLGNPRPPGLFDAGYSGALLHFQQVDGLRLEHIRLHNAEAYYARFTQVRNFHI
ncbi:MAG: endopolygalacturonase, partial [Phycisphaerae bacterium]